MVRRPLKSPSKFALMLAAVLLGVPALIGADGMQIPTAHGAGAWQGALAHPAGAAPRAAYQVQRAAYDLGETAFTVSGVKTEGRAVVHYPKGTTGRKFPVVMLVHGNHATCAKDGQAWAIWPCRDGAKPLPNYEGYDYLGKALAARGYVTVSVGVSGVMADQHIGGDGAGPVLNRHLDKWRDWQKEGATGTHPYAALADWDRVGLFGHSQGGAGVAQAALGAKSLEGVEYPVERLKVPARALFLMAPPMHGQIIPTGIPTAAMAGTCDGDVQTLDAVRYYDYGLHVRNEEPAPKYLFTVRGANHNFFNTAWSPSSKLPEGRDEATTASEIKSDGESPALAPPQPGADCKAGAPGRLGEDAQRQIAADYVTAFFRRHLTGDKTVEPLLTGAATTPTGKNAVSISYQAPAAQRLDINRLTREAEETRSTIGGTVTRSGPVSVRMCTAAPAKDPSAADLGPRPSCAQDKKGKIVEPHYNQSESVGAIGILKASWDHKGGAITHALPAGSRDVSRFTHLRLRAAVDPTDARNTPGKGPDFSIVLTDGKGASAAVPAARWGHALDAPPSAVTYTPGEYAFFVLGDLRVPLTKFRGLDMKDIKQIRFVFDRTDHGNVGLADLRLSR